jgi:predicted transcriptional regulator
MDIVHRRGRATAAEVLSDLPDPPSYSAVRAFLRLLEERGHLRHEQDGPRYVYMPTERRERARKRALNHVVSTFFDGSPSDAVAALLESDTRLTKTDLDRLSQMIEKARERAGQS